MTYKEAIECLQPVADNTTLSRYGAALTAAIYALHMMDEGAVPVVHGRWKFDVNPYSHRWNYKCIVCGGWATDETDYCPNCGAKMDAEDGDGA